MPVSRQELDTSGGRRRLIRTATLDFRGNLWARRPLWRSMDHYTSWYTKGSTNSGANDAPHSDRSIENSLRFQKEECRADS